MAQAAVLRYLRKTHGDSVTRHELETHTKLDKNIISECLGELISAGAVIDETKGCVLVSVPDLLFPANILSGLETKIMGREIHCFKTIGSTNEVAKRLAESGLPEGTMVIAEKQSKGRGRLGRQWHSPSGKGLYFSIILRPQMPFDRFMGLSLVTSLALCKSIEHETNLKAMIKWPNDCLVGGKKVAGILVELSAEIDRISYAILGVGINVNTSKREFPVGLRSKVTSLAIEQGQEIDRMKLLWRTLSEIERHYQHFQRLGLRSKGPELSKRSVVLGKRIDVRFGKNKIQGVVTGFDQNGAIRLHTRGGVEIISAGEVTLRK